MGVVPEQYRTPEPATVPTPSPSPSIEGLLSTIPAPESYQCRTATDAEREMVRAVALSVAGKPVRAVDLGEGFAALPNRGWVGDGAG